jgi:hypothetical protein
VCSVTGTHTTGRVADGDPGVEVQVDFGRFGLIPDPAWGAAGRAWVDLDRGLLATHIR